MFSSHIGNEILKANLQSDPGLLLPYSVTRDTGGGRIFIKVVNPGATEQAVKISLDGAKNISPEGSAITLHADNPTDTNSSTEPTKIVPETAPLKNLGSTFLYTFRPYSITVLEIRETG